VTSDRLPVALSRVVASTLDGRVVISGGLRAGGNTTAATEIFDPTTHSITAGEPLRVPVHDAGAGVINSVSLVIGGGSVASTDAVQGVTIDGTTSVVGHLPQPRSDDSVAASGATLYVLGGYDGVHELPGIVATSDGATFRPFGELPETVRYGAACVAGNAIWMFGGEHGGAAIAAIQRIDAGSGRGRVVGRFPHPLAHAGCAVVGGRLLVIGGTDGHTAQTTIYQIDPSSGVVSVAGSLPEAVSDMAVAVVGGTAFVIGGEVTTPRGAPSATSAIVAVSFATSTSGS
jgi:hypothetical protein